MQWEVVIGLETHVELSTRTKIFCGCTTEFGGDPNTHCCPVCIGMPGTLPVLNRAVVEYAVRTGLALNCGIESENRFDRKNYFYPDLPKAYQISQLYVPVARNGFVSIQSEDGQKYIRIHEIHMEEDAGKLVHDPASRRTLIDYNRCGVPLLEIVTEPDFRTGDEVIVYLEKLKSMLVYLGVSDCKMQEGSLRCDVNVSVRRAGSEHFGTRTEMKNMSSFRAIRKAIRYEAERQIALLESGGEILQETRRWDEEAERSILMRSKENAQDYRYFPEPDLPLVRITEEYLERMRKSLPEFADQKKKRYMRDYHLSEYDAGMLTEQVAMAAYFERGIAAGAAPKNMANWMLGDMLRLRKEHSVDAGNIPFSPEHMAELIMLVDNRIINRNTGAQVLEKVFLHDLDPMEYVRENGLEQETDDHLIAETVDRVLLENGKSIQDYLNGKEKAFGFLVGQTMRLLRGKADPAAINECLRKRLTEIGKQTLTD